MFLQLAEGENNGNYQALAESNPLDNYVFIPGGFLPEFNNDTYVRADYFASNYDPATANALINQLNNMQTTGLSVVGVGAVASAGIGLAKKLIANRQAKVQAGTAQPIGKPGGILDKIRTKIQGAQQEKKTEIPPFNFQGNVGGTTAGVTFQPKPDEQAPMSFWQKYKTPILIGGGALVLIGGVYMFTRKKRR
jgi:hypothetical protein